MKEIVLPAQAGELLANHPLELKMDRTTFTIPASVLKQLAGLLTAEDLKDSGIVFSVKALPESDAGALIARVQEATNLTIKAGGPIYNITLVIQKKDGQKLSLPAFHSPVGIRLQADAIMSKSSTGIYSIGDNGDLAYVGGKLVDGEWIGEAYHFSQYAVLEVKKTFNDVLNTHWAWGAIDKLSSKLIIQGTSATTFEPKREVTRAEFVVMLMQALQAQQEQAEQSLTFTDQQQIATWAQKAVTQAAQAGYISGYTDGSFRPQAAISRAEMAVIAAHALGIKNEAGLATNFTDGGTIPSWAQGAVDSLVKQGIITGRTGGKFDPSAELTRAEAAVVIANLMAKASK